MGAQLTCSCDTGSARPDSCYADGAPEGGLHDRPEVCVHEAARDEAGADFTDSILHRKVFCKPGVKPDESILKQSPSSTFAPAWAEPSKRSSLNSCASMESCFSNESSMMRENTGDSIAESEGSVSSNMTRQSSCGSAGSTGSSFSGTRGGKRRHAKRLMVTHTMGSCPSNALKIVIENGDDIHKLYSLDERVLGKGSFGTVKEATLKASAAIRAVKIVSKEAMKDQLHLLKKEIEIMKMVDHPCLLMLYEIFEDSTQMYLVMQMCAGGHVLSFVKKAGKLTESQAAVVVQQVVRGVRYLHKHLICHRDLKAENCLLDSRSTTIEKCNVKVADFGLSRELKKGELFKGAAGTLTHMAPEVLDAKYGVPCDLWSSGVMTYFLLSSQLPFPGHSEDAIKRRILKSRVKFATAEWVDASEAAMAFINGLLVKNPKRRYSAEQALVDPWIVLTVPKLVDAKLHIETLDKVIRFRALSKFQRAVLHVMAAMLPDSDIKSSRQFFIMVDVNGDGTISMDELREALGIAVPTHKGKKEKDLSYTEFLAATIDVKKHVQSPLFRATFSSFDKNGDGALSISEVSSAKFMGALDTNEVIDEIEAVDLDGDLTIDFEEFQKMMILGQAKH